jgi:hypothetical protein
LLGECTSGGEAGAGGSSGAGKGAGGHPPDEGPSDGTGGDNAHADAPSELLVPLLEQWRDVLVTHVLSRLDAMLARVGKPWLAVVVDNDLPRAGSGGTKTTTTTTTTPTTTITTTISTVTTAVPLGVSNFVGSVARLAWAKENGCDWTVRTCAIAAGGGHLDVLQWAREHVCPWDTAVCARRVWEPGDVAMGAGARLPVERVRVCGSR